MTPDKLLYFIKLQQPQRGPVDLAVPAYQSPDQNVRRRENMKQEAQGLAPRQALRVPRDLEIRVVAPALLIPKGSLGVTLVAKWGEGSRTGGSQSPLPQLSPLSLEKELLLRTHPSYVALTRWIWGYSGFLDRLPYFPNPDFIPQTLLTNTDPVKTWSPPTSQTGWVGHHEVLALGPHRVGGIEGSSPPQPTGHPVTPFTQTMVVRRLRLIVFHSSKDVAWVSPKTYAMITYDEPLLLWLSHGWCRILLCWRRL